MVPDTKTQVTASVRPLRRRGAKAGQSPLCRAQSSGGRGQRVGVSVVDHQAVKVGKHLRCRPADIAASLVTTVVEGRLASSLCSRRQTGPECGAVSSGDHEDASARPRAVGRTRSSRQCEDVVRSQSLRHSSHYMVRVPRSCQTRHMLALTATLRRPSGALVHLVRKEQNETTYTFCGGFDDSDVLVDYTSWDMLPADRRCSRCADHEPRWTKEDA